MCVHARAYHLGKHACMYILFMAQSTIDKTNTPIFSRAFPSEIATVLRFVYK